jgi:hypothetical protein
MAYIMMHLNNNKKNNDNNNNNNNNNNHHHPIAAATIATTISVLAMAIIIVASTSIASPVAATTTTTTTAAGNTTTTTSSSTPSGIKLSSSQPIYQEHTPPGSLTPINQTYVSATHSGNGTLTLPNSTQTINTASNGTAIISFATSSSGYASAYAKETIRAANGETATVTAYEIVQFSNPAAAPQGGGKGIVTAVFQTNSTGILAPLNGVIAAGIDNLSTNGEGDVTFWRWESGISSNSSGLAAPPMQTQRGEGEEQTKCDSSYPGVCIPPPPLDLDCGDVSYHNFKVLSPDPHGFDKDNNGIGCES